jgi:glucokinase
MGRRGGRMLPSQSHIVTRSLVGDIPGTTRRERILSREGTRELQRHSGAGYHKTPPALHRLLRCHTHNRHGNAAGARVMLNASKLGDWHGQLRSERLEASLG